MSGETVNALLIVLGFVLLVVVVLVAYFYRLQARYYQLTEAAIGRVDEIRVVEATIFTQLAGAGVAGDDSAVRPLQIEGSKVVPVGGASAPFKILTELPADAAVEWSVEPANSATKVVADDTRSATIYTAVPGVYTVSASATAGGVGYEGGFETVAAVSKRSRSLELPWPGRGLGTLIVIVILLGAALLLALTGLLDGAVATLLTAIAGFAFGVRALEAKS